MKLGIPEGKIMAQHITIGSIGEGLGITKVNHVDLQRQDGFVADVNNKGNDVEMVKNENYSAPETSNEPTITPDQTPKL